MGEPAEREAPDFSGWSLSELLAELVRVIVVEECAADGVDAEADGLTIREFAEWAGVDRRRLARDLVVVPPGAVPTLPSGKVPCRLIGSTRRIFLSDFLGDTASEGAANGHHREEAPASPTAPSAAWARQVDQLRRR